MFRTLAIGVGLSIISSPAFAASPAPSPAAQDPALFASERAAVGSGWEHIAETTERGTYDGSGLKGPYVAITDTHTGFTKSVVTIGGTTQSQGYDAKGAWQGQGGLVQPVEDAATLASAVSGAYVSRNGWWNPADPATFSYAGRKTIDAGTYDVVRVVPKGGDAVDVWLDAATHLVAEMVETDASNVTTTTYLRDYRTVDGVRYPFSTTISTGDTKTDQHLHAASVDFATTVSAADVARPHNERTGTIAGANSTTIPFELDNPYKGHIVLLVRVNGSRPLHVVFDTGGSNIVTPQVAREIGLKGKGSVAAGGAGEQQVSVQFASGATLQVGGATLADQPFGIFPLPQSLIAVTGRYRIDGVIGYEVLKNFVVSIDYVKRTLTLTDPSSFHHAGGGAAIHFASATVPVIPATFDGVPGQFMFDTGNAFYSTVSKPFIDAHGLTAQLPGTVLAQTSGNIGGAIRPRLVRPTQIEIGPYRIVRPVFAVTDTKKGALAGTAFSGNIAETILTRFDVTLDYAHDTIYMKPNANFNAPYQGSLDGMSLYESDAGELMTGYVNPGSPAAKAGLATGDRILSVDGVPASHLGPTDVPALEPTRKSIAVTFERNGVTHRGTIVLMEMVP